MTELETRTTDPAPAEDRIDIYANDIPETTLCMVSLVASGHVFFQISVPQAQVDEWAKAGQVCGKAVELFVAAHPASRIVNRLMEVMPSLTSLVAPKELDDFKQFVYDTLREAKSGPT